MNSNNACVATFLGFHDSHINFTCRSVAVVLVNPCDLVVARSIISCWYLNSNIGTLSYIVVIPTPGFIAWFHLAIVNGMFIFPSLLNRASWCMHVWCITDYVRQQCGAAMNSKPLTKKEQLLCTLAWAWCISCIFPTHKRDLYFSFVTPTFEDNDSRWFARTGCWDILRARARELGAKRKLMWKRDRSPSFVPTSIKR